MSKMPAFVIVEGTRWELPSGSHVIVRGTNATQVLCTYDGGGHSKNGRGHEVTFTREWFAVHATAA